MMLTSQTPRNSSLPSINDKQQASRLLGVNEIVATVSTTVYATGSKKSVCVTVIARHKLVSSYTKLESSSTSVSSV